MKIINLNQNHLDNLVFIENSCFPSPVSSKILSDELKNDKYIFIGCEIDGKIVGYCNSFITCNESYINNIAVLDKYRNHGIGSNLLESIISFSKNKNCEFITLEVRESNLAAIGLYKKFRFKEIAIRKNYYSNPIENAKIMTLKFGE